MKKGGGPVWCLLCFHFLLFLLTAYFWDHAAYARIL